MDARVFDTLTRRLGEYVPRRSLGGLVAVLLAMFGAPDAVIGKKRGKADGRQKRHRRGRDRGHHGRRAADHVQDEKKKKKRKKKKGKAQPVSPPPPGNASPPPPPASPPQSPPPPGGGDGDSFFDQQVYETCLGKLAPIIGDHLDLSCADNRCATAGTPDCTTCVLEVLQAHSAKLDTCLRAAVAAGGVAAPRRSRGADHVAAGGTDPISTCHGSKYVVELAIAERDAAKPARDAFLTLGAGAIALAFKRGDYATIVSVLKVPSDIDGMRVALAKIDDVERKYGCKLYGLRAQCVIENPGSYDAKDDGICCPMLGIAKACGGTCCYSERCQRCVAGVCQECAIGTYCHEQKVRESPHEPYEVLSLCETCPACTGGVCEKRTDTPADRVEGTPDCPPRSCNGPCGQGKQCLGGVCKTCPAPGRDGKGRNALAADECCVPQTCAELGVECDSHDDGCEGTVQCGGCPSGKHCEGGVCTPDCTPKTCAEVGNACGALADGCGGTVSCGCPSGKQCEGGICKDIDPCATGICRWSGTIRQKWTFHGTGIGNAVTTLDVLEDTTYEVLGNSSGSTTTTQGWHWITDDPNICEHHVQSGGWDLSGHTEPQVVSRFALSCAEPGTGGGCSFNFSDGGRSVTVQECSTCQSGTCCTAGCHDVGVGTTPAAHVFGMGTPTGPTLAGSNTYSEHLCSWGFCGTRTYDWTWNLSYGPIS